MRNKIEILAPAGSYEGMKAAMNAGCDAVYIGGSSFGARAFANNLDEDTLLRAIDEAHIRDKKLYLTVNTLLKEKELTGKLYAYLEKFYLQGLDAVIVQDLGVLHFIHEHFPDLPIHASTQMTLTMAQGANLLKDYGVTRLVTSRELNLQEIKTIRENTELEIETFVHGALCYCYSGQCLMSSMIGGRSGNRGRCAQPCRMPYQYYSGDKKHSTGQEKYLLSPKDINTIAMIPDLVDAGINSFKIEGRMKRPEYAAAVSYLYRKYTDLYEELGKESYQNLMSGDQFEQDMIMLQDVYNRGGFSQGYSKTYHGKQMMSLYRPNHSGVYVGKVSQTKGIQVTIQLSEKVNAQDILEIRHQEEDGYEFTVKDPHAAGEQLITNVGRRPDKTVSRKDQKNSSYDKGPMIQIGDEVYRTKNNELLENLAKNYLQENKKLGIKGQLTAKTGEPLKLTLSDQDISITTYHDLVQEAMKQPMTREKLRAQLLKTGDTLYEFDELQIDEGDNIFVPVAWLNEIRRDAINQLEQAVAAYYHRSKETLAIHGKRSNSNSDNYLLFENDEQTMQQQSEKSQGKLSVSIQTIAQFDAAIRLEEVSSIYADYDFFDYKTLLTIAQKAAASGKSFFIALPQICRMVVYDRLEKDLSGIIIEKTITGFLVKNLEEIGLLQSLFKKTGITKPIHLNYNMYVFNQEAKAFWREQGITRFTAPIELNYQELKQLGINDCELLVYGYLPLMISAQCLHESTSGCAKSKKNNTGYLVDRLGKKFFVQTNCIGCYNTIYNGQVMALHKQETEVRNLNPASLRMDFTIETEEETKRILQSFINTYCYGKISNEEIRDYTTGHFKRGIE